jgi:hypothetical protein
MVGYPEVILVRESLSRESTSVTASALHGMAITRSGEFIVVF